MGFQAPNQGLQGPQVPKKGILKQNSNQGPQFNQGQQNQAPNQNLQNKALNQRMQNIASNQGLQNMAPKQNQGSNQNLQNKALNQRMQNLASNQGLQNMAPNQNQAPNHGLQNMAPNQRMQMSQNQASMSWNQTPNPRQLSNQGYQDQGPMSWNQIGNSRQMGSQNKNFMNQGLQRTQNFESGNDQMDTTTSDSKGWLEVPPPDIYKPKFSKFPDKPADKKGKDSNAMSFYEAERLISAKLEKDWEMGKAGIGAETPQETVSKLFGSQTESDSRPEKKPITKMKFEKPTTKVNYSELVQKAHKTFGKKSITDSGNEKKENKSAPWDWKKPASKPAAKWTETSQNKKDSWSRQPKKPQQPMKKSVSESSLDTCQAHQGLGSILQRLATDGDIETDDGSEETESEMPQNPLVGYCISFAVIIPLQTVFEGCILF